MHFSSPGRNGGQGVLEAVRVKKKHFIFFCNAGRDKNFICPALLDSGYDG